MNAHFVRKIERRKRQVMKKAATVSRGGFGLSCGGDHWSPRE
jgi:hypothetical protein